MRLPEEERVHLRARIGSGTAPVRTLTHARILLEADQGEGGPAWADALTTIGGKGVGRWGATRQEDNPRDGGRP